MLVIALTRCLWPICSSDRKQSRCLCLRSTSLPSTLTSSRVRKFLFGYWSIGKVDSYCFSFLQREPSSVTRMLSLRSTAFWISPTSMSLRLCFPWSLVAMSVRFSTGMYLFANHSVSLALLMSTPHWLSYFFCRQTHYYFLTDEGVTFLRKFLNIPEDINPATIKTAPVAVEASA